MHKYRFKKDTESVEQKIRQSAQAHRTESVSIRRGKVNEGHGIPGDVKQSRDLTPDDDAMRPVPQLPFYRSYLYRLCLVLVQSNTRV